MVEIMPVTESEDLEEVEDEPPALSVLDSMTDGKMDLIHIGFSFPPGIMPPGIDPKLVLQMLQQLQQQGTFPAGLLPVTKQLRGKFPIQKRQVVSHASTRKRILQVFATSENFATASQCTEQDRAVSFASSAGETVDIVTSTVCPTVEIYGMDWPYGDRKALVPAAHEDLKAIFVDALGS